MNVEQADSDMRAENREQGMFQVSYLQAIKAFVTFYGVVAIENTIFYICTFEALMRGTAFFNTYSKVS